MKTPLLFTTLIMATGLSMAQDVETKAKIVSFDPSFAELIDVKAPVHILATGFGWSEGPIWDGKNQRLLFTDVPGNRIHAWDGKKGLTTFLEPSGFSGVSAHGKRQGANGLAYNAKGELMMCEHGDRRVSVLTEHGGKMTVADNWDGKRFSSPNDLIVAKDGSIYFTDPPYGLRENEKSPDYQTGQNGVYRIAPDGKVTAVVKGLGRPNGLCFSLDEKTVFVAESDTKLIKTYAVKADGSLGEGKLFFDCNEVNHLGGGGPDGIRVDEKGNVWTTGPGGVVVLSPEGKKLGAIQAGSRVANLCWGEDGKSLFLTAHKRLLRVKTLVAGGNLPF